jgi:DNA-binding transcriptional regulator YiaG
MTTRKWKEDLNIITPLEYILFKDVPMKSSPHGEVIDTDVHVLELMAAKAVIQLRVPIRGKELGFLRKVMGLSYEKFAGPLGLSAATVMHWEKAKDDRLHGINEVAVRAYLAELLNLKIDGKFSTLLGNKNTEKIELKAS